MNIEIVVSALSLSALNTILSRLDEDKELDPRPSRYTRPKPKVETSDSEKEKSPRKRTNTKPTEKPAFHRDFNTQRRTEGQTPVRPRRDKSKVLCFNCDRMGHYVNECKEKTNVENIKKNQKQFKEMRKGNSLDAIFGDSSMVDRRTSENTQSTDGSRVVS